MNEETRSEIVFCDSISFWYLKVVFYKNSSEMCSKYDEVKVFLLNCKLSMSSNRSFKLLIGVLYDVPASARI